MRRVSKAAAYFIGVAGSLLVAAAQTPPDDAVSNIGGWADRIGGSVPSYLRPEAVDVWATTLGAALLIGALAYLYWSRQQSRHELSWAKLATPGRIVTPPDNAAGPDEPPPPTPINPGSLGAYMRGYPTVQRLTKRIAAKLDVPVSKVDGTVDLAEEALAFGIRTIADLDAALLAEEKLILRAAAYLIPEKISPRYCVNCLFWVLGGRMGADAFYQLGQSLRHVSFERGFARDIEQMYKEIAAY